VARLGRGLGAYPTAADFRHMALDQSAGVEGKKLGWQT
jgi:hypothetical protein